MKEQFILFIDDIKSNLRSFLISTLQLGTGLLILCYILQTTLDFQLVEKKITTAMKDTEIYMLRDNTSDKKFDRIINEKKYLPGLQELYGKIDEIKEKGVNIYVANGSMKFYFSEEIALDEELAEFMSHTPGKVAQQLSVTENFFDIYNLEGTFDKKTLHSNFCNEKEKATPLILGYGFRKYFHENEVIQDVYEREYRIVGFLNQQSYYVAPDVTRELISLENVVIKPYKVDLKDSVSIVQYFDNLYFMTDDRRAIDNIVKWSSESGLFEFLPINFSYQLEVIIEDTLDEIFVNSTFMVIILIYALVGIIGNLLQFIAQYKREFAINMLCGATMWQIILRILMQVIVMFGIALLTVLAVYGIRKAFWLIVLCSAVFIVLVLIYPVHMIAKSTIQSMFKRSYE